MQALRQLDEVERRDGSSKALREARRFLMEQPDDAFRSDYALDRGAPELPLGVCVGCAHSRGVEQFPCVSLASVEAGVLDILAAC